MRTFCFSSCHNLSVASTGTLLFWVQKYQSSSECRGYHSGISKQTYSIKYAIMQVSVCAMLFQHVGKQLNFGEAGREGYYHLLFLINCFCSFKKQRVRIEEEEEITLLGNKRFDRKRGKMSMCLPASLCLISGTRAEIC